MPRTKKRLAAGALCAAVSWWSLVPSTQAAISFPDVRDGQWFSKFVDFLSNLNVVSGYPNNEFRPHNDVTRAEFATMLAKSQNLPVGSGQSTKFADVPASHWAAGAVNVASSRGWIAGYPDGTFGPSRPITNAEMYTIVSKLISGGTPANVPQVLAHFSDGSSVPAWAEAPVAKSVASGIFVSEVTPNQIDPYAQASRADVSTTLAKLLNNSFRTPIEVASVPPPTTTPPGEPEDEGPVTEPPQTITSSGILQHEGSRWFITTSAGTIYGVAPGTFDFSRFTAGDEVQFIASTLPGMSHGGRPIVNIIELNPIVVPGGPSRPPREDRTLTVRGTLNRSANGVGWILTDRRTGTKYALMNVDTFSARRWFTAGASVEVMGELRPRMQNRLGEGMPFLVSDVRPLQAQQPSPLPGPGQREPITIRGNLARTVEPGGWVVTDSRTNQKYLLQNIQQFQGQSWFREGGRVKVDGTPRPGAPTTHMEGIPLRVTSMEPINSGPIPPNMREISIRGMLRPTVTAGGWTLTDRQSQTKYVLMNIDSFKNRPWFRDGARVEARGIVRPDMPNIYMEGTPFDVHDLTGMMRAL